MPRRALILCSIILAACSTDAVGSAVDTNPSSTAGPTTSTTSPATSTSTTSTSTTSTSTTTTTTTPAPSTTTTVPRTVDPTAVEQAVIDQFTARAFTMMASDVRAVGIAITRHDSVIHSVAFGTRPDGALLEADAPFRIASISKVLTATAVLQLVDQGALQLDDSLADVGLAPADAVDPNVATITVRQLLGHTSGIGKLRQLFFGAAATDWRTTADVALHLPLAAAPGTAYAYSNANYTVLGVLVEHLTGLSLEEAVRERVLRPLGITDASMVPSTGVIDPAGPAYVVDPARRYMEALGPAGAWVTSAEDLARVVAALQPDSATPLLQPGTLAQMRTPTSLVDDEPDWSYGLGLMVFPWATGHTGTIEDVRTFALTLPNGYSVAVLSAGQKVPSGEDLIAAFGPELLRLAALPSP